MSGDQPAEFFFKLRQNIALDGDVELARMELAAFLPGPLRDLAEMAEAVRLAPALAAAPALADHVRPQGVQGMHASAPLALLPALVRCLSFVQRIYCVTPAGERALDALVAAEVQVGPLLAWQHVGDELLVQALPHYLLLELSDVVVRRTTDASQTHAELDLLLAALLDRPAERRAAGLARTALKARSTTGHLAHDVHYYKAKFFPRMARSMLNICARRLDGETHQVVDNFCGSGTTLLEAASLGMPAVGLDLDPLSVLIARAKLAAVELDSGLLAGEAARCQALLESASAAPPAGDNIVFPDWLLKNRKMTPELAALLGKEIALGQAAMSGADPQAALLLRVLLSDAIARRVRMRFLGTGAGRFSLTLSRRTVPQMLAASLDRYVRVTAAAGWLRRTLQLELAPARVLEADARQVPADLGRPDILLTSPPYLPASSGRESYARARALSLIALGIQDRHDVDYLADRSIGSMNGDGVEPDALLPGERAAVEWLQADELRAVKAGPTAQYFVDMRRTFRSMRSMLAPGALAVVVSGKQSTFYQFSTRRVLYVVEVAELLAQEAQLAGFEVERLVDVQLAKQNRNARPRSLDDYYETLIMLRNPA